MRGKRAEATKYLNQLKTANVPYLEGVEKYDIRGVLDFLPLVYSIGCDSREKPRVREMQVQQAKQGRQDWKDARARSIGIEWRCCCFCLWMSFFVPETLSKLALLVLAIF
jgi:hypothetical protein